MSIYIGQTTTAGTCSLADIQVLAWTYLVALPGEVAGEGVAKEGDVRKRPIHLAELHIYVLHRTIHVTCYLHRSCKCRRMLVAQSSVALTIKKSLNQDVNLD